MGTAPTKIVVIALFVAHAAAARAESCTGTSSAGKFALCFDPGNRISVTAGSDGFGGAIAMRHIVHFVDEPDLVWKLEHVAFDATHAAFTNRFSGAVYRGYFMRHARDGHIVLPGLGAPKKLFLPFDIGAFAEAGTVTWRDQPTTRIGVINMAGLVDFARTRTFRQRIALGPSARWDVDVMQARSVSEHFVAPFSTGMLNLHFESNNGRLVGDLRAEAGMVWSNLNGWEPQARAEALLERIVLAINDRPISLVLGARYESETGEALARIGARIVLFDRHDPRVSLD